MNDEASGSTAGDTLVLCYHTVDPVWDSVLAVEPDMFTRQIARLLDDGYESVGFTEAVESRGDGRKLLAVTFDDGYESTYVHARPILRELGAVGTVFVVADYMTSRRPFAWAGVDHLAVGPQGSCLTPLSWDQLGELIDDGWEVGSHTLTHKMLPMVDLEVVETELARSRAEITARLGTDCVAIAYPYGEVDPRVIELARVAGYRTGAGLHAVDPRPEPLNWPRTSIYPADVPWRFHLKVSPRLARLRARVPAASS